MPLDHTRPPESLARELREVAHDAVALIDALTHTINVPVPVEFPKDQLIDVCKSLVQLPAGTAEGCRTPLDYALRRLPAIRREYILSEELSARAAEAVHLLTRGETLDQKLCKLISSVTTALDEYRRLVAEEEVLEIRPEASVAPAESSVREARARSEALDSTFASAQKTVEEITHPESNRADDLKRQLHDARGLNRLAWAEIKMPRVVVSWLRKTIDALKDYPELIRQTVKGLRLGTDVALPLVKRWHSFEQNFSQFVIGEWRSTLDVFDQIANTLDDQRRKGRGDIRAETASEFHFNIEPEMVVAPTGNFMMGSPKKEGGRHGDEDPRHKVMIAKAFEVSRHAVTRGQFAAFVKATGHKDDEWSDPGFSQDDNHPVVCVNWEDARAYAAWLARETGKSYRLLSEAEWEYAARAGSSTPFWWGSSITPAQANYDGSYVYEGGGKKGKNRKGTVPIGSFEPNPWGLYNVHGNVWEWCEDVWHDTYKGAPSDGSAWLTGGDHNVRVVRGGSWSNLPGVLRSANRVSYTSRLRNFNRGFRLGRTLTP